ncbi:MAG: sulfurtransferase TusA family protein [Desulfovibrio sp.]|uniref:sulfurtransferase TusA family protein n=1 Tax=Desulfovibrio sp. TaxID=885 RepID=UPI002E781F7D|nr:sulfurtransferase TusA family protein [Desulfovibrio sp.]MEE0071599.1 sulfurtransferase TusA family protein [Desulfovibrio sp.]
MATLIDTCGLSCPQPVLMFLTAAKKQLEGPFSVLVDNEASRENVTRAARNSGFDVTESEENGIWRLEISRQA